MYTLLVSYDLDLTENKLDRISALLKTHNAHWHDLQGVWLIKTEESADQVCRALRRILDASDKVLVINISRRPASWHGFTADQESVITRFI